MTLLDDFNDTVRARIDKNRATIDHRVAIVANAVFLRDVIVGNAIAGQVCAMAWSMPAAAVSVAAAMPSIHALLIGVLGIVPLLRNWLLLPGLPGALCLADSIGNRRCPAQA